MAIVQIIFDIEEELRKRFKAKVAMEGTTIKNVLTKMIEKYLQEPRKGGMKEPTRKKGKG